VHIAAVLRTCLTPRTSNKASLFGKEALGRASVSSGALRRSLHPGAGDIRADTCCARIRSSDADLVSMRVTAAFACWRSCGGTHTHASGVRAGRCCAVQRERHFEGRARARVIAKSYPRRRNRHWGMGLSSVTKQDTVREM
jgi:hypothetical protein